MKKIKNYVLEEQMGVGKFGIVFKGKNLDTDETVAIKLIKKSLINNQCKRELLLSEVHVMEKLKIVDNKNIVKLIEFMETARNFYLILEYCNDGDFKQYLQKSKKLDEETSIKKFRQILNGMKILLENEIIHRDIKTANIFIHNGDLKIGDFGFASDNLKEMLRLGTPLYMAPELLNNESYSSKVDVWSLGVIFYQMIIGDFPFKATSEEKLKEIVMQPLKFNKEEVSQEIQELFMRIFDPNQETRISLTELIEHPLFAEKDKNIQPQIDQFFQQSKPYLKYSIATDATDFSDSIKEALSTFKSITLQNLYSNALQQQQGENSGNQNFGQLFPIEMNQETMIMHVEDYQ